MSEYTPIPVHETSPGSFTVQFPKDTMTGKFERNEETMSTSIVGPGYTPTTEEIRDGYSRSTGGFYHDVTEEGFAEFDRWLAEVVRQAKAEAWESAVDCLSAHWEDVAPKAIRDLEERNPYRGGSDE